MSFELFGVDVAQVIADAFDGNTSDCTLMSITAGTYDPAHGASGTTPTKTPHAAQGFITERTTAGNLAQPIGGGQAGTTESKTGKTVILLFGNLIADGAIPTPNDQIIMGDGAVYTIVTADFDDTRAAYLCTCRP